MGFWFWTILCALILLWYIMVTLVVAYKGWLNIQDLIQELKSKK